MGGQRSSLLLFWVVAVVACLAYLNTLPAGFTFDDNFALVSSDHVKSGGRGAAEMERVSAAASATSVCVGAAVAFFFGRREPPKVRRSAALSSRPTSPLLHPLPKDHKRRRHRRRAARRPAGARLLVRVAMRAWPARFVFVLCFHQGSGSAHALVNSCPPQHLPSPFDATTGARTSAARTATSRTGR